MSGKPTCGKCGAPAPSARICVACEDELRLTLATIPDLAANLNIAIAGLAVLTDRSPGYGPSTALPFNERAAKAANDVRMTLAHWAEDAGMPIRHLDTIPPMRVTAWWLSCQMSILRQHTEAAALVAELTAVCGRAWHVIDKLAQRVYAGPCPHCRTDLLSKPGHTQVTCMGCGTTHDIAERQAHMRDQLDDYLGTATYAAAILVGINVHVTEATIRGWAFRHRLEVRAVVPPRYAGQQPQPLYRLGDIITLVLERDAKAGLAA